MRPVIGSSRIPVMWIRQILFKGWLPMMEINTQFKMFIKTNFNVLSLQVK